MGDYWQDKQVGNRHVATAWGLVLALGAFMLVVSIIRNLRAGKAECGGVTRAWRPPPSR
jgi:hypothetical protein